MRHILSFILISTIGISISYSENKISGIADEGIKELSPKFITNADTRRNRNHFQKGAHLISLGYGFPAWGGQLFSDLKEVYIDDYSQSGLGPIFLKYDYAFNNNMSIGFTARYTDVSVEYPVEDGTSTTPYTQSRMSISGLARFNYHFGVSRQWDPYAGVGLGYNFNQITLDQGNAENPAGALVSSPAPIAFEATAGARFFITPKFAVYGELGYSQSLANLGVTFKL